MDLIERIGARGPKNRRQSWGKFKCPECGDTVARRVSAGLKQKTCGCCRVKHGQYGSRLYKLWSGMIQRCSNPKSARYSRYGGRGIKVCDAWKDFATFSEWATKNGHQNTLTIDRIDNDGDYCPENCRWVTRIENLRNSTVTKLTVSSVKTIRKCYKKGNISVKELSKKYDVSSSTISSIINNRSWHGV